MLSLVLMLITLEPAKADIKPDVCYYHPIYCQIIKNNPKIKVAYAIKLSNSISRVSKKYNINPVRYTAILAQESMYKLNAKNCKGNKCHDYGISQINHKTAKAYGFDLNRLMNDLDYSVEAGAIVLADLKKSHGKHDKDFWTRYNSPTAHKREKYRVLVVRYM